VSTSAFTDESGTSIAWARFARAAFAFIVVTIFGNIAELVAGVFEWLRSAIGGVTDALGALVGLLFGPVTNGDLSAALADLSTAVGDLGVPGFPLALLAVVVLAWGAARARRLIL